MSELDIQDDDYTISVCGHLYSKYSINGFNTEFSDFSDCIKAIIADMKAQQFYPNVYFINDHGNIDLLAINTGTGEYSIVDSWV